MSFSKTGESLEKPKRSKTSGKGSDKGKTLGIAKSIEKVSVTRVKYTKEEMKRLSKSALSNVKPSRLPGMIDRMLPKKKQSHHRSPQRRDHVQVSKPAWNAHKDKDKSEKEPEWADEEIDMNAVFDFAGKVLDRDLPGFEPSSSSSIPKSRFGFALEAEEEVGPPVDFETRASSRFAFAAEENPQKGAVSVDGLFQMYQGTGKPRELPHGALSIEELERKVRR